MEPTVAIVKRIGECDIQEIPNMRMPYSEAIQELKKLPKKYLKQFDLVYVNADQTLGRYASWQI